MERQYADVYISDREIHIHTRKYSVSNLETEKIILIIYFVREDIPHIIDLFLYFIIEHIIY